MLSHLIVYRRDAYKKKVNEYHEVIARQHELIKLTSHGELFGREATPAKAEFQSNISRSVLLKRDVFRVSSPILSISQALVSLK